MREGRDRAREVGRGGEKGWAGGGGGERERRKWREKGEGWVWEGGRKGV